MPLRLLACALLVGSAILAPVSQAQRQKVVVDGSTSAKPLIVSPTHPQDSLSETVYETQGDAEKDIPALPGAWTAPVPVKLPKPTYPKSLKKDKQAANVSVEGVISAKGDFIDARVESTSDPDAATAALNAVARYKFKPATLDGKPVAFHVRIVVNFQIY